MCWKVCLAHFFQDLPFLSLTVYSAVTGGTATTTVSATSTTASSFTNLSVPTSSTVNTVFLNCPSISSTTYTAYNSSNIFAITCGMDYPSEFPNNKDIVDIIAYSLQDCLQACSEMVDHGFAPCAGATFLSEMGRFSVGNCFLKGFLGTSISEYGNASAFGKLL